jgi:hypothetical protein
MFGYFLLAAACLGGFATGYLYFFRERPPDPDMARSASSPAPASSTALPVAKTPESAAPVRAAPESAHPERSASAPPPAASSTPPPEQAPPPPLSSTETATPPPGVPPQPAPAARREIPGPAPSAEPLTLVVASEPQGARAVLDGNSSSGCVTPCPMRITPGRHRVAFSLAGYRDTTREIVVKPETTRLPAYTLAPAVGVLMIQSQPDGAAILVNGRAQTQKTPAQMNLPPGRYQISVEKGGQRASQTVDLKDGDLRLITLALAP